VEPSLPATATAEALLAVTLSVEEPRGAITAGEATIAAVGNLTVTWVIAEAVPLGAVAVTV